MTDIPDQAMPQGPGPQPVPMMVFVNQAADPLGNTWVRLDIQGPTGTFVVFLDPASAATIAEGMAKVAAAGRILLAGNGTVPT